MNKHDFFKNIDQSFSVIEQFFHENINKSKLPDAVKTAIKEGKRNLPFSSEANAFREERVIYCKINNESMNFFLNTVRPLLAEKLPEEYFSKENSTGQDVGYLKDMYRVLKHGVFTQNRTGFNTIALVGTFDSFPYKIGELLLPRFKKINPFLPILEMLFFLNGSTNTEFLNRYGSKIWDPWSDEETGELGPIYGYNWHNSYCKYNGELIKVDAIANSVETFIKDPLDRKNKVIGFNSAANHIMKGKEIGLDACHTDHTLNTLENRFFLSMNQRSCDMPLGVSFNRAQYSFLQNGYAIASKIDYELEFQHHMDNYHFYSNQLLQVLGLFKEEVFKTLSETKLSTFDTSFLYSEYKNGMNFAEGIIKEFHLMDIKLQDTIVEELKKSITEGHKHNGFTFTTPVIA